MNGYEARVGEPIWDACSGCALWDEAAGDCKADDDYFAYNPALDIFVCNNFVPLGQPSKEE